MLRLAPQTVLKTVATCKGRLFDAIIFRQSNRCQYPPTKKAQTMVDKIGDKARLYFGDTLEILPALKHPISLVLCDPPYGISYQEWDVLHNNTNASLLGDGLKRKRNSKPIRGWSSEDKNIGKEYEDWVDSWLPVLVSKCKPASALLFYNSRRMMHNFINSATRSNLLLQDIICVIKPSCYFQAFRPFPQDKPEIRIGNLAPRWEPLLVFRVPFKGTNKEHIDRNGLGGMDVEAWKQGTGSYDNVINSQSIKDRVHPTQKDVGTLSVIIKTFSPKNAIVLDPFMGSGSTGVAAIESGRRFVGIEKNEDFYDKALGRVKQAHSQTRSRLIGL